MCAAADAFFAEEEDLTNQLINHGELERASSSTFTTFWGEVSCHLVKGQLMLQALDCLRQNPTAKSAVHDMQEQILALMEIDFQNISTLEELTDKLDAVQVGARWWLDAS